MQPHLVSGALPWLDFLPPIDGQDGQEGQLCRCNVPTLPKSYSLWSSKHIRVHAFIHQTCMATSWQKTNKHGIILLYMFFTHLFKMFRSFLTKPMHGTSSKYGIPSDHISRWHLVEHYPSILHAPTFAYMSTKLFPTKTSDSKPFEQFPDEHTCPLQGQLCWHRQSAPHKSNRIWQHSFLLHLSK